MNPAERLKIVKEIQKINNKQIANREKSMELSKQLEADISNEKIKMELLKLEVENMALFKRNKQLVSEL